MITQSEIFDVVICGGGLSSLTLAKQLKQMNSELSVLVLDRTMYPVPETTHKVGESSTEIGSYYLGEVLGLKQYIEEEHFLKLGLRYFYSDAQHQYQQDFSKRPEFGPSMFPEGKSYQMNRGKLENHLWQKALEHGVVIQEGVEIEEIVLAEDDSDHEIRYYTRYDGKQSDKQSQSVWARWVVDAMGRRRYLQKKLNLARKPNKPHSAAWFRLEGMLDVSDWVPASNVSWHERVCENRWFSTNHLTGQGYWIWLIPLVPCNTSVGIVTDEAFHPFETYNTLDKAMIWIDAHEPHLANQLDKFEMLDFKAAHNYSYSSHQVFSTQRWSCVGDAGTFIDPYYSVALNMIAFANSITCKLIELNRQEKLTEDYVAHVNQFYLSLNDALTHNIQRSYEFYDNAFIMSLKTIWDFYVGVSITDPQFYNDVYLDPKISRLVAQLISPAIATQARMMELFRAWAKQTNHSFSFQTIDYTSDLPTWKTQLRRNLPTKKRNLREILGEFRQSVDRLEELAHAMFLLAVEDVMPEKLDLFAHRPWLNTTAIGLDSDHWVEDGLFQPKTSPRDYSAIETEVRRLYRAPN
ncbi:MAG: tryptophan 7-halogenase [Chloroflexota bacterium]